MRGLQVQNEWAPRLQKLIFFCQDYYFSGEENQRPEVHHAFAGYYKAHVEKRVHDQDTIKSKLVLEFHRKMFRVLLEGIVLR